MFSRLKSKKREYGARRRIISSNQSKKRYLNDELESLLNGWQVSLSQIDDVIEKYHGKMLVRSREQHRKNDYVRRYFQLLKTNVIGADGIVLHALLKDSEGKRLSAHNEAIEQAWRKWSKAQYCDISARHGFCEMQQLILSTVAQDGEAIIRIIHDNTNPFGLSLQLIDSTRLDVHYHQKKSGNTHIRHGIECDKYGRAIAYHFLEDSDADKNAQKKYQRIEADDIIHLFRPDFIGQKRGIPWVATALFRLKMLDSYQDAAIVNANAAAKKINYFKRGRAEEPPKSGISSSDKQCAQN